ICSFSFFFFFSSRRRHTRFSRDWSSDVCSSDLEVGSAEGNSASAAALSPRGGAPRGGRPGAEVGRRIGGRNAQGVSATCLTPLRSEERRVGKEGRSRGSLREEKEEAGKERGGGV